jgi:hypothetical protein
MNDIKLFIITIKKKHGNNQNKMNKELNKLKKFVQQSDIFKGRKRKIYKLIKSNII